MVTASVGRARKSGKGSDPEWGKKGGEKGSGCCLRPPSERGGFGPTLT